MVNIEDYVEIFKQDAMSVNGMFVDKDIDTYKVRLLIGYKVKGMECYLYESRGNIFSISKESRTQQPNIFEINKQRAYEIAKKTWNELFAKNEWSIDFKLYSYHFGIDYRVDDQGEIIGDWPMVAMLTVYCDAVFLIKDFFVLPEEFSHLRLFPYPKPTGKVIK